MACDLVMKTIIKTAVIAAAVAVPGLARATPVPLPFTYPYATLPKGEAEDELYGDMTPLRVHADPTGAGTARLWEPAYVLQNEIEYGVTDRVELAWYQVFESNPVDGGSNATVFDGFKFRGRLRLAEEGQWPVDVALYLELETLHDEMGLEEKVILGKRFGKAHWMANLWVEESYQRPFDDAQRQFDFTINPTTGFTYEVTPTFQPGIEYWARGVVNQQGGSALDQTNNRVTNFVGPTLHFDWGKVWWSVGVYANLNTMEKPEPGVAYGPIWARTLLGLTL